MNAKQLLSAMADLFEKSPERHTHGAEARDVANNPVDKLADDAYSFSVGGFLERAAAEGAVDADELAKAYDFLVTDARVSYNASLPALNDVHGREAVIASARRMAQEPA